MQMRPADFYVGPPWLPSYKPIDYLQAYDYLASLSRRDWAWEGLRRNSAYQAAALADMALGSTTIHMEGRALLTRMQDRGRPADAWALCSFRRSVSDSVARPSRLAAGGWHLDPVCYRQAL